MKQFKIIGRAITAASLLLFSYSTHLMAQANVTIIPGEGEALSYTITGTYSDVVARELNLNNVDTPYSEAKVKIQSNYNAYDTTKTLIVYLLGKDTYTYKTVKLEVDENMNVLSKTMDYVEEQVADYATYSCPDESVEVLLSKPTLNPDFPTATTGINAVYNTAVQAGYKVRLLMNGEENIRALKNWYSCKNLKMHGRIGHGLSHSIMVSDGSLSYSYFQNLPSTALQDLSIYYNSCQVHNSPFEPAVMRAGARTFIGGNVNLKVGPSEEVFKCWAKKALINKEDVRTALSSCEIETRYRNRGDHGVSNVGSNKVEQPGTVDPGPGPGPDPDPGTAEPWKADKIYNEGDRVRYESSIWQAQWWNQGQRPGATQWGPWKKVSGTDPGPGPGPDPDPTPGPTTWKVGQLYEAGDTVTYDGAKYQCLATHTAIAGWTPPNVPALWGKI